MKKLLLLILPVVLASCNSGMTAKEAESKDSSMVKLITVDPGHFHAALVQKTMYSGISPDVYVYAPAGTDVQQHLDRIESYNTRKSDPTSWNEIVYTGPDFFEKMLSEKRGNVVVLSGNNRKKAEYIARSIDAGLNVLADKPMIINPSDFHSLTAAFKSAREKGVLLYDIMTERYEVTTILQKMLSMKQEVFGTLAKGTEENPAVTKISVHHFSKIVSGTPLQRPAWFFDVDQQGEGIVDVTTHLVDLVQWECFPEQILDTADVQMIKAKRWATVITPDQFSQVTGMTEYPSFLQKDVKDGNLNVFSNGEMTYSLKGVFSRVSVEWKFQAPEGTGDTHYSVMRGTNCDLMIRQGKEENYIPQLYIENIKGNKDEFLSKLKNAISTFPYDSLIVENAGKAAFRISIPQKYRVSHEEHFGQVTGKFLEYIKQGSIPEWEIKGMITKYYTTTKALKLAKNME
jgi:predicted dehydrogenase